MRLSFSTNTEDPDKLKSFAEWILDVGDGKVGELVDDGYELDVPHDLLLPNDGIPIDQIVNFAYPNLCFQFFNHGFFEDKAILAPIIEAVEKVNDYVINLIEGEAKECLSFDTICKADEDIGVENDWITTEFLNDIKCSGMPNHRLILKLDVLVMLLRNIDQSSGLCNGTRLIATDLCTNIIGCKVATGTHISEKVYIPRMNLIPSDSGLLIRFQRRQFPLALSFSVTINKSQGQTLSRVGLFLPRPVFSHGQLYVAISRIKNMSGLKILICEEEEAKQMRTINVVYP